MRYLRKLCGVVGFGVTWGVVWAAVVAVLAIVIQVVHPNQVGVDEGPLRAAAIIWRVGFVTGAIFGALVTWSEGGKAIEDLSVKRAAMFGMLSAAVFPLLTDRADQVFWTCPVGALAAVAMFVLARKAERLGAKERGMLQGVLDMFFVVPIRCAVTPPPGRRNE